MSGLGHTARGLFAASLAMTVIVAGTLCALHRWPLAPPAHSIPEPASASAAAEDDRIRVALTRKPVTSIELRVDGAYRVIPLDGLDDTVAFQAPLSAAHITADSGRIVFGEELSFADDVELIPEHSAGLWVADRQYRGTLRLHRAPDDRLWVINVLPLEEYLPAVVDAEMPAAFPSAAREAQAIVARSYAISCRRAPPHRWFDLFATPVSQNYLGVVYRAKDGRLLAGETPAGRAAVQATRDIVCTCQGRLFRTFYSACCGGRTFSGKAVFDDETAALCSVICGGCDEAPLFRWERSASGSAELVRTARTRAPAFGSLNSATTIAATEGPGAIVVSDGRQPVRLTASEVKSALSLPSLCFELTGDDTGLTIRGRGHGHGVGLCQWGAKGLAEQGMSASQILQHYYPGSELTRWR